MITGREDYDRLIRCPDSLIRLGEPVLLIRGQDTNAYATALVYVALAEAEGASEGLIRSMRLQALALRDWPEKKVPDVEVSEGHRKQLEYAAARRAHQLAHGSNHKVLGTRAGDEL